MRRPRSTHGRFRTYLGHPGQQLHELLAELNGAGALDWSKAVIDSSHVRALKGGPKTGPSPAGRAKPGSKHHLITEGHGIPLAVSLTGGQRNDVTQLMPLIAAIPPVRGRRGRPRRRPEAVSADRGYDHDRYRRQARATGITPVIARRGTGHGSGLDVHRWVVEQSIALLHWFRRLRIRWGDPRRHPRGVPQPRLRHHLLAPPDEPLIVLGVLRLSAGRCVCRARVAGADVSAGGSAERVPAVRISVPLDHPGFP